MMESLLRNEFVTHYSEGTPPVSNLSLTIHDAYFEIEDDLQGETQIYRVFGAGSAKLRNPRGLDVAIVNYDKFITSLSHSFQNGRKRCDRIIHTVTVADYFILAELKDRKPPQTPVRRTAKPQLFGSLQDILRVPKIKAFADGFQKRRCCLFNKKPLPTTLPTITAIFAFNPLPRIVSDGLHMSYPAVEALGFEYFEYLGGQVLTLS
jgi:hypothetical protein